MKAMHKAIQAAVSANLLIVCAAGNKVKMVVWPASYPETLAIAANNHLDARWSGSSRGKDVDVSAPGEQVWHAEPDVNGKSVKRGNGTSYATATTAGVAALWLAFFSKQALEKVASKCKVNLQEIFRYALKSTAEHPAAGTRANMAVALLMQKPC